MTVIWSSGRAGQSWWDWALHLRNLMLFLGDEHQNWVELWIPCWCLRTVCGCGGKLPLTCWNWGQEPRRIFNKKLDSSKIFVEKLLNRSRSLSIVLQNTIVGFIHMLIYEGGPSSLSLPVYPPSTSCEPCAALSALLSWWCLPFFFFFLNICLSNRGI